ncbi:hypothetical protein GCM10025868_28620 [Angustibacter aerolatus]|uniref:Cysteine--tRNA ligase n=1 Tax=Angustibacter aerolatus TaxID=1162965 RepID=A0ABQ6JHA4_9ACTN|nr:DALR domain-containing protein [Angustibacter aerolatus]GMA87612.1 hypothetical protein GCM10025868_28620 [Angustibacter aerolatus]
MEPAADADPRGKRDPRDFALWKGAKPGEPETASWSTPYGRGRPGWHLECSAMARRYLGDTFDIHGGGVDLRFPHHENEQAQSRAAGLGFARYWLHNAWVTVGGEKMSKSLGNSLVVANVLRTVRPLVLRYYLGAAHYRSTIEYRPESLQEAQAAVERIEGFLLRAGQPEGTVLEATWPKAFAQALDDDLNVSQALAVVHETVRAGNTALDEDDDVAVREAFRQVVAMTDVLGINPLDEIWSVAAGAVDTRAADALEALVAAEARHPPAGPCGPRLRHRRRGARPARRRRRRGRGHPGRRALVARPVRATRGRLMPGNSERRGATRKGPRARARPSAAAASSARACRARGPRRRRPIATSTSRRRSAGPASGATPRCRRAAGHRPAPAGRATARRSAPASRRPPARSSPAATASSRRCAPRCRSPRCTSRAASTTTTGCARR